jgi:hypothetical protein
MHDSLDLAVFSSVVPSEVAGQLAQRIHLSEQVAGFLLDRGHCVGARHEAHRRLILAGVDGNADGLAFSASQ